jgi:hypothetical protein
VKVLHEQRVLNLRGLSKPYQFQEAYAKRSLKKWRARTASNAVA